jgi:cyclohexadienyl dehydratase
VHLARLLRHFVPQPQNQQLAGIDIDNARELAKELGSEVKFVDSSFAKLVDDVTADKCDIAMFAVGITPQRQEKLRFTQPHLVSDIYAITTQSNRRVQQWADLDKPGNVLAVAKGTLHEAVMKTKLKAAELRVVDTPAAREQEVQSGRADAFMTDFPFSRRMLDNNDWARLVSPTETYHLTPTPGPCSRATMPFLPA